MRVGVSGGSTEDYREAGLTEGVPQGWVEEEGGLSWQLAQREFFFFFFRNLVAWFSYLSQYIFTYLLLK